MRKILCGNGRGFFLTLQSLSLDRFRLQAIGLRTRQFNLQPGTKKESTAKFGGTEKWKKFFAGRKTFNEIKNAVQLEHTRRTVSLKEVWCIPSHLRGSINDVLTGSYMYNNLPKQVTSLLRYVTEQEMEKNVDAKIMIFYVLTPCRVILFQCFI